MVLHYSCDNELQDQSRQGGYCFVFFTNQTSIQQALESMAHNTIDEVVFDCSISKRVNGNLASTSQDKDPNDDNCDQEA